MDEPADGVRTVIAHDFGHDKRAKTRRFRERLGLDALHEVNVRENPLPYLERASERIFQLERALFEANLAAGEPLSPETAETATVPKAELERLRACRAIVRTAVETLVEGRPDDD